MNNLRMDEKYGSSSTKMDEYEEDESSEDIINCDPNLLSEETIDLIMRQKENQPNHFQSYWEKDEEDIDSWTRLEINADPGKQLLTYAESGNLVEIKELLGNSNTNKELIKYKDNDGYTCVHRASYSAKLDCVKYLLNIDKTILETKTNDGWTCLHSASYWNNYEIVDYLINKRNANINALTNSGQTPLHLASSQRDSKETIILLLMNPYCNFKLKNSNNETASQIATRSFEFYYLFEIIDNNLLSINT